jgi:UDP-galactopyranose mutase
MEPIVIVGAGLSGAVFAERCANVLNKKVIVIEKRQHVAGNCYDFIDENGIIVSKYGAHIFHTSDKEVWQYIQKFAKWHPYEHKVLSYVNGKLVPIPININTVNHLLGLNLKSSLSMKKWIRSQTIKTKNFINSEEVALSRVGNKKLYELMFKNYTYKQWSFWPKELEPSVLSRIPIRFNKNDRYFDDVYEAIPNKGYTDLIEQMLSNPLIEVVLNTDYFDIKKSLPKESTIVYTGPIDRYFDNKFDVLQYRSLRFETETINTESYQQAAVINYPSLAVPYTRIVEYKKLYGSKSNKTVISREFPTWEGEPFYPVPTQRNRDLYEKYKYEASQIPNTIFVGRLANYKYFNMDQAIKNALQIFMSEFMVSNKYRNTY